jgi:hypothetical protein
MHISFPNYVVVWFVLDGGASAAVYTTQETTTHLHASNHMVSGPKNLCTVMTFVNELMSPPFNSSNLIFEKDSTTAPMVDLLNS